MLHFLPLGVKNLVKASLNMTKGFDLASLNCKRLRYRLFERLFIRNRFAVKFFNHFFVPWKQVTPTMFSHSLIHY